MTIDPTTPEVFHLVKCQRFIDHAIGQWRRRLELLRRPGARRADTSNF